MSHQALENGDPECPTVKYFLVCLLNFKETEFFRHTDRKQVTDEERK